jgi:ATP-dependent DNA helicase DinG
MSNALTTNIPDIRAKMFGGLTAVLGDGGKAFEGTSFEASAAQRDYSQHWAEAIVRSIEDKLNNLSSAAGIVLISADTGTGKTVGYGVPSLLKAAMNKADAVSPNSSKQIVISTHSHALQRQFMGDEASPGDIAKIIKWLVQLGYPELVVARRVGRQAFISLDAVEAVIERLRQARAELRLTAADLASLELLREFAEQANDGENSGLIEDLRLQLAGNLPCGVTSSSICLGADSSEADGVCYEKHLVAAENADVLLVSHAFLASCALFKRGHITERGVDVLVIDEADRLADVAASAYRFEISLRRGASALSKLPGAAPKLAFEALDALASFTQSLHGARDAVTLIELPAKTRNTLVGLAVDAKKQIINVLNTTPAQKLGKTASDELERYSVVLDRFIVASEKQEQSAEITTVEGSFKSQAFAAALSFSPVRSLPSLVVMPTNAGQIISRLWNLQDAPTLENPKHKESPVNCVLLTSATLGAPGRYPDAVARFKSIAAALGVATVPRAFQKPEFDLWAYFEPSNFGGVRFILADPSVPSPTAGVDDEMRAITNEEWMAYAVNMTAVAKAAGGRTLVLTTSYKDTQDMAEKLLAKGIQAIEQVRGQSTRDCEAAFLADANAVWISPTAWEGLNLPGMISNVVIPRLPFYGASPVEKALLSAQGSLTGKSVDNILSAKLTNATKRKLRQGMFRAIRSKNDKSRIYVGDPRFPLHALSQIPMRHPASIRYGTARAYPAFHAVIPTRFLKAFENAEVYKMDGTILK